MRIDSSAGNVLDWDVRLHLVQRLVVDIIGPLLPFIVTLFVKYGQLRVLQIG
jgi:hypothetical protein